VQGAGDPGRAPAAERVLDVAGVRVEITSRHSTTAVVDDVSLFVRPGETLGVVGESGSGKTMTAMSVMRLLPPGGRITAGSISVGGTDVVGLPESRMRQVRGRDVGMVFQDPMTCLNPTMSVGSQIAEPVRAHLGASRAEALARAAEILGLVGMPRPHERLRAFPHELSGGLRQRVVIAMALACSPKLLIADEPTTALDVTIQDQILALLDELRDELHMGMLLITHDMGVIAGRADRVSVMYAGRVVETGTIGEIFQSMRHPYTQALLESIPDLDTDRSKTLYSIPGTPPDLAHLAPGCRFAPRCRYVQERCLVEDPRLEGDLLGHQFACFHPVDGPHPRGVQVTAGSPAAAAADPPAPAAGGAAGVVDAPAAAGAAGVVRRELLVLDHVVKTFPIRAGVLKRTVGAVQAVSDVSLSIGAGETFGLVGESGCGKTTLGRMIVNLERPDSGRIVFDGHDDASLDRAAMHARRTAAQLMFQDPYASLDPRMRIRSILREPLDAQHIGTRESREARIRELLDEVGLSARALELYPHEFSGGQRQRIGLARALTVEPRLVVADEPVSALDVSIQSQILNLMRRLQAEREFSYVVISHDLSVVRYLSDRVGVMYLGKLVEIGPVEDVYEHTAHPYTAGLLEAIPVPDPRRGRPAGAAVRGELPSAAAPPSGCRFRTRCARAEDLCAAVEPPLRAFSGRGHEAACHFPLERPLEPEGAASSVA